MKLYQITYPVTKNNLACFGILVKDFKVVFSAPIGKWMVGKTLQEIKAWVSKKRGTLLGQSNET